MYGAHLRSVLMDKCRIDDLGYFPFAGGFRTTGLLKIAAKRVSGCVTTISIWHRSGPVGGPYHADARLKRCTISFPQGEAPLCFPRVILTVAELAFPPGHFNSGNS
jgi:hypothetical protein